MATLIYDSVITGHHSEYISHLVDYLVDNKTENKYVFVVPIEFKIKFPAIYNKSLNNTNITWDFIEDLSILNNSKNLISKSLSEYKLMNEFALKYNVNRVLLMYFNIFQLALILKKPNYIISGILFLQFYRMDLKNWKEKLKYYRKYLTTKLYTSNKKIQTVFVLNDQKSVDFMNGQFKTNIFKMLPDPVPEWENENNFNVFEHYNIDKNKKIILHPGAISERKGTIELIDGFNSLDSQISKKYCLLIVGKASKEMDLLIKSKISKEDEKQIVFDNVFLANERLQSLFKASFTVAIPYKNPEASSGILGHSIKHNLPVIINSKGLLKELFDEYNYGVNVETVTKESIVDAIKQLENINLINNTFFNKNYIKIHSSNNFSALIL